MPAGYELGVLDGDGIGAEIVPATAAVVDAAVAAVGAPAIRWRSLPMGATAIEEHGAAMPDFVLAELAQLDGWVLGPHDNASYPREHLDRLNPSGAIRKHFDLFANIRPARAFPGASALLPDLDVVIVRENTQGFYGDRNTFAGTGEWMPTRDVAIVQGVFTRAGIERVARAACLLARQRSNRLTIVHKANVLRLTTGMFLDVAREVAAEFDGLEVRDEHVDAVAALLVSHPRDFDVVLTENMHGDILSDLTAALVGSLGIAPSINASLQVAMAQAAHGSAPDIAGRDVANPVAMMLSGGMLLAWLGANRADESMTAAAAALEDAIVETLAAGTATTDLGGQASTSAFTAAVVEAIGPGSGD